MAYVKPIVQVYQELANSGGAPQLNPSLPACIIGPLYNTVTVDPNDSTSLSNSVAGDPIASWADLTNLQIVFNPNSSFAGQVIDSVMAGTEYPIHAYLANPYVVTYRTTPATLSLGSFEFVLSDTFGLATSGAIGTILPDGSGEHVQAGDLVRVSNGTLTEYTSVYKVDYATNTITLADSLSQEISNAVISVFRKYAYLDVTGSLDDDGTNYSVGNASGSDFVTITGASTVNPYGVSSDYVVAAGAEAGAATDTEITVHAGYRAQRGDLDSNVTVVNDVTDLGSKLGTADLSNPLGLGVSIALANSGGTAVYCIALDPTLDEAAAYTKAFELAEAQTLFWITPLTTNPEVHTAAKAHVDARSLPTSGNWRMALVNTEVLPVIPVVGTEDNPMTGASVDAAADNELVYTSGTFIADVNEGDWLVITDDSTAGTPGRYQVGSVVNNQKIGLIGAIGTTGEAGVTFYIERSQSKLEQAQRIEGASKAFANKRVVNFPGTVMKEFNGVDTEIPGYYLLCGVAGQGSGLPAQTGFTNTTVAGIGDLVHGNFYFTEDQLNMMAGGGTTLYVQNAKGTAPFCRHALTTDMSVLEYREILKVKNWDYVSYYFKDILAPFIGTWNITPDTIQTIRQTVLSAGESMKARKLPKVGAPLTKCDIVRIEQNATSKDAVDVELGIGIADPNNYTNVYLVI